MKTWLLTVGEPLPQFDGATPRLFRTGLLARVLTARGHEVTWWTSAFDHYAKRHRVSADTVTSWEGGEIRLLRSVGYRRNLSPRRFVEHAGVARKFLAQAMDLDPPDVVLASLPTIELAHAAVRFGAARGVPVVIDIRDLWPDAVFEVLPRGLRWMGRVALHGLTRRARASLRGCAGMVGVSDGYLRWGLEMAGRGPRGSDGVFPMGYVRPAHTSDLREAASRLTALGVDGGRKICWYVGSFGRTYDLSPVISAARTLQLGGREDVQFVICGDGELAPRWRRLAEGLGNVVFTGWIGAEEIAWLGRVAAVGLQPYAASAPQGLPNKLFEYMSTGIPVVSSLRGECEELLSQLGCGLTYEAGDEADFLLKLLSLLDDDTLRGAMGARARMAFDSRFDGNVVLDGLAAHLEMMGGGR